MFSRPVRSGTIPAPTSISGATLPMHGNASGGRLGDAGQQLEQRALAGAVVADDAEHFALLDREVDVVQRLEGLALLDRAADEPVEAIDDGLLQADELPELELLGDVVDLDDRGMGSSDDVGEVRLPPA